MRKIIIINGAATNYEVSDLGEIFNLKTNKQLKGTYNRNEYHSVQLTINNKPKSLMTHRLVAEAFVPNPNNYEYVAHLDGNKYNNKAENLVWCERLISNKKDNTSSLEKGKGIYIQDLIDSGIAYKPCLIDSKYIIFENGYIYGQNPHYPLKGSIRNGYIRIDIGGKRYSAHRLIWEAFNGEFSEDGVIDHIDGNRSNNALSNLRLVSQSDNMYNAQKNGHAGQVGVTQYSITGEKIEHFVSLTAAASSIGVTSAAIRFAAGNHTKSKGYYWIRDNDSVTINDIINK